MFDDLAILDTKKVVVRGRATFRVGLDQSENEIAVGNIAFGIENRRDGFATSATRDLRRPIPSPTFEACWV